MSGHRIEVTAFAIEVTGPRHPRLDAITADFGSYRRGTYTFPKSIETRVREALADTTPAATPNPPGQATGWSKAARRRAGQRGDHPLGNITYRGDGYTEYHDGLTGHGTVQIWDES